MADLPQFRVSPSVRPFMHVGIDYAGPLLVRASPGRGRRSLKAYISLFICMATKAVHLEVVSDYSTSAFLAALHRFISRRGTPSNIYTDNGTNFVGADRELTAAVISVTRDQDLLSTCAERGIEWKFNPPSAPHFGGIWEVAVRAVKRLLTRTVGTHTLTFEELNTVLCRIEACLNSRPLSSFSDNLDDYTVLTPGHFLIGAPLVALPEPSVLSLSENRLSRWQLLQQLTERFWSVWSADYLRMLQHRSKWTHHNDRVYPGRMVLIINPGLPPGRWSLGRILQCHPGPDGQVRVVTVQTATSSVKRPVTRLCLLPADINRAEESGADAPE